MTNKMERRHPGGISRLEEIQKQCPPERFLARLTQPTPNARSACTGHADLNKVPFQRVMIIRRPRISASGSLGTEGRVLYHGPLPLKIPSCIS